MVSNVFNALMTSAFNFLALLILRVNSDRSVKYRFNFGSCFGVTVHIIAHAMPSAVPNETVSDSTHKFFGVMTDPRD